MRIQSSDSEKERQAYQPEEATGGQSSKEVEKKKPSDRPKTVGLSPRIEEIVLKTNGILTPDLLHNFLKQVRGRRNQMETAAHFTTDFPSLFLQLEEVEKSYYLHGERGTREDKDIAFIKRMRKRLTQKYNAKKVEASISSEQSTFKRQSCDDKDFPQNSMLNIKKNMGYDSQNEADKSILTRRNESGEDRVRKSGLREDFPKCSQSFRIPNFSTESRTVKYPEEKLSLNLQRNLSCDRNFIISSSLKPFSSEEERQKCFPGIGEKKFPLESQSRQILNGRKRSSSEENSPGKFEMNYSFHKNLSPSYFSGAWWPSTDNDSLRNSDWDVQRDLTAGRSIYTTQPSTDVGSLENFRSDFQRNLFFGNSTTGISDVDTQSSISEEIPVISTRKLRQILASVKRSSENISFEKDLELLPCTKTDVVKNE